MKWQNMYMQSYLDSPVFKCILTNLNNVVRTQVSYYILTCVRVFYGKKEFIVIHLTV